MGMLRRPRNILIGVGALLGICVVLGIIGALTGGGGGSKKTATSVAAVTTPKTTVAATMTPTAMPTTAPTTDPTKAPTAKPTVAPTPPKPTPATADTTAQTAQLKQFVDDHFGGSDPVAWYPKLTALSIVGHAAVAQTSLQPSGNDLQLATLACQNLSAFVFNNENKALGLNEVLISGTSTTPIVDRKGKGGSCTPLAQP